MTKVAVNVWSLEKLVRVFSVRASTWQSIVFLLLSPVWHVAGGFANWAASAFLMSCEFIEKLLTSPFEPVIKVIGALAAMSSSLQ